MRVGKFGLALAAFGSALLAGLGQTRAGPVLVDDPGAAVNEIIGPLQEARAQDAADAVKKYMVSTPNGKYDFDTVRNGFTAVSQGGKADVVDEIEHTKYGSSIQNIVEYLHFPPSENPTNQFLFVRFIFMKLAGGWQLTNFTFVTTAVYPPPRWPGSAP